jgi:hypothetical protein
MGFCISGRCQGLDTIRIGGTALFGVQTVGQDFFDGWSMVITLWKGPGWGLYDVDGIFTTLHLGMRWGKYLGNREWVTCEYKYVIVCSCIIIHLNKYHLVST